MDGAAITRLWITPRAGDESKWLLAWHPTRERFELPAVGGQCLGRTHLAASVERRWGLPLAASLAYAELPLARLTSTAPNTTDGLATDGTIHAAWLTSTAAPNPAREQGLEWVSAKDVAMGFTTGGRSVDPAFREILEQTGRYPRGGMVADDTLTVGVTGHRDLLSDDVPVLFDKLHQALEDLAAEFPGRRLRVLSPLAEGADQLMADVALERGLPLISPLPLPLEQYEADFSPPTLEEFRSTLDRSCVWYCLPLKDGAMTSELQVNRDLRNEHYAKLGQHVVDRSDVLLALWDGRVNGAQGGTADVLRYALAAPRRPGQRLLIRHVPTRRGRQRGAF